MSDNAVDIKALNEQDRSKKEASHEVFEEKRKEKEAIREQAACIKILLVPGPLFRA